MSYLKKYLKNVDVQDEGAIAFFASIDNIAKTSPTIANSIISELKDQRSNIKLIASENYCSLAVQQAMGNLLTDKYSEGFVKHRFYAGCENIDTIEQEAVDLAKKIFNADHAYVQPHSGADANLVAFFSILVKEVQEKKIKELNKNSLEELTVEEYDKIRELFSKQKLMGLALSSGGHLTHGFLHNVSSKIMKACSYEVDPKTNLIDYDLMYKKAKLEKPLILLGGYSAYPRLIDFAKMKEIANSVGAVFMVDMAHFAGLVAGGVLAGNYNPVPFADVVTSTTHKTLRGPRGGLILCKDEYKDVINKGCPLVLGGPMPHVMAAKAVAFREADTDAFKKYAKQIVENAKYLAEMLIENGAHVITNGTDNHLILLDVFKSFNITGRQAEIALRNAGLTVNRNSIPQDINGAWYTSGVRLGTAAITTLGMRKEHMKLIADVICNVLKNSKAGINSKTGKPSKAKVEIDKNILEKSKGQVKDLLDQFVLYSQLKIF
jgi:glycine hydroxymethyltransferase